MPLAASLSSLLPLSIDGVLCFRSQLRINVLSESERFFQVTVENGGPPIRYKLADVTRSQTDARCRVRRCFGVADLEV